MSINDLENAGNDGDSSDVSGFASDLEYDTDGGSEGDIEDEWLFRDNVRGSCMKIYNEEKEKRKLKLMNLDGQISISAEILRCAECNVYMCLNAHFIDENWKLQKWIISYQCVQSEAIDDFPIEAVKRAVSNWGIRNKISTFTYEHDWFDEELIDMFKDHVKINRSLHLGGKLINLPCCEEVFQLMAKDTFKGNQEVIHKIEELWCSGKSHPMWNCTYGTMKDTLEAHTKENYFAKAEYDQYYEKPSPEEWDQVKGLCQILDVLLGSAKVLFETKQLTTNMYLPNLQELQQKLTEMSKHSDRFIARIVEKILRRYEKYFKEVFLVLAIATVMDPRYKMKYLEFSSVKYGCNDGKIATVFEAICTLYDEYASQVAERENPGSNSISPDSEEMSEQPVTKNLQNECADNFNWLSEYNQFVKSNEKPPSLASSKTELDLYLEDPVLPWSMEFDILTWWRKSSSKYPVLSRIARDALGVPLSAVTGHAAYWVTEREIEPTLKSMGQDGMNAFKCTQSWLGKQ